MLKSLDFIDAELAALEAQTLLRTNQSLDGPTGPTVMFGDRQMRNFSSNDYLSLANDPRVRDWAAQAAINYGGGSGASRLLGGDLQIHRLLEARIAQLKGTEGARLFSSGFAANVGTIPALVGEGDAVFSDALNHASIIDGCRLSRAERFIYRHLDLEQLSDQLKASQARRKLIVTETLFSMDGDIAPLPALCDLADRHGAILMVDEAHATGIYGDGAGLCRELKVADRVPVQMGTLSKALGASGAYVAGERRLMSFLLNRARSYVFSTAPNPASCGAAFQALEIIGSPDGADRRAELLDRAAELKGLLRQADLPLIGGEGSHLLAVRVSDPARAVAASEKLEELGFLVRAIRPPTVPEGTSRLRICLQAKHSISDVKDLVKALVEVLRPRRA